MAGATPTVPVVQNKKLASFVTRSLPPKVHTLAEGAFRQLSGELERAVLNTLSEFEAQLFVLAEQARNPSLQGQHLQALRQVREGNDQFLPRFRQRLESALAGLRDADAAPAAATPAMSMAGGGLSLVEVSDVDESVVLNEIAGRAEMRAGLSLFLLGQRFGVLARKPGFDAESLPVGPAQLCRMVADAALCFEFGNEYRLLLLRQFDKQLTALSATLFESLNTWLASKGVLPHLTYMPFRAKPSAQPSRDKGPLNAAEPEVEPATEPAIDQGSGQYGAPPAPAAMGAPAPAALRAAPPAPRANGAQRAPAAPAFTPPAAASDEGWGAPFAGMGSGPRWPGMPSQPDTDVTAQAGAPGDADDAAGEKGDQVLYDTLRHLLSNRRSLVGKLSGRFGRGSQAEPSTTASPQAVNEVLDRLQKVNASPVIKDGKAQPRSVANLKQDLLMQLRAGQPDGAAVGLPPEYNDSIELVGMLLDHLVRDLRPNSPAAGLLTKLQVPLLRVALEDKAFFNDTEHPARQLLNTVTETADWFSSDDPADKAMLGRMRGVVDRVVDEYKGEVGLLQELLGDVRQHLQVQVKRAEVAERRHVEAARGKEKLELARIQAAEAVTQLTEGRRVPRFATSLLSQSWSDVLALSMLRHGPESEQVKHQIGIAERLIDAAEQRAEGPASSAAPVPEAEVQALRGEIEEGLLQVGYHAEDAQAVSTRLTSQASGEEDSDDTASRTELSLKLKQRPRFGADADGNRDDPSSLTQVELAEYQKIKRLPFGTWFEFIDESGGATRRRLSWYSPMTGHSLFVNHRGQRVGEFNLSFLAREMVAGRLRLMVDANTSIVDRAWKAIVGALKTFTGRSDEGGPLPAQVTA